MLTRHSRNQGFTIVEVAVIVPIIALIVLGILAILIGLIGDMAATSAKSSMAYEANAAVKQIEQDFLDSRSFIATSLPSNFNVTSPMTSTSDYKTGGTTDGTNAAGNLRTLIMLGNDRIKNPINNSSTLPAKIGTGNSCNDITEVSTANILPVAIVYYVNNGILYRRVIPDNTGTATCGTALFRKNCPTTTADCAPKDSPLLYNIRQFEVHYFINSTDAGAYNGAYSANPSPTIDTLDTMSIYIKTERRVSSKFVTQNVYQKMTRNDFN